MTAIRMLFRGEKGPLIGWSIGLSLVALITIVSFPTISGDESLDELWNEYPEALREAFGGAASITQIDGYLDSQLLSLLPILMGIHVIMHASRTLAGAEEAGRLDLLLSTPLRRGQLALAHIVVILLVQTIVALIIALVLVLGAVAFDIEVKLISMVAAVLNVLPAVYAIAGVTFMMSAIAHRRNLAVVVGTVFLATSYFFGIFSSVVDALEPLKYASVTWHHGQSKPLGDGVDWLYVTLGLLVAAVTFVVGWIRFQRKDITG